MGSVNSKEKAMSTGTNSSGGGVGVLGLLGVAFVVLKLTGFIDWSWWWVTLPFWGGIALVFALIGIRLFFSVLADYKGRK